MYEIMPDDERQDWLEEAKRLLAEIGPQYSEIARRVGRSRQLVHYHLTGARKQRRRLTPEQAMRRRVYAREYARRYRAKNHPSD
jgi:transposase-like protein